MLATNLRQFRRDLDAIVAVASDRERCRQLLANVEFLAARAAAQGSALYSWLFRCVVFFIIAVFPIIVLAAVQTSALRYQSEAINETQRAALVIDLLVIVWFFLREQRAEITHPTSRFASLLRWIRLLWPTAIVMAIDLAWLNIPDPATRTVRALDSEAPGNRGYMPAPVWQAVGQPLDCLLCPWLHWGCRYLTLDHRTLLARVWKPEAIAELLAKPTEIAPLAGVEGVFLRDRKLRFAKLDESHLYGANLINADLTNATLSGADLRGAILSFAKLGHADLTEVNLTGVRLNGANLAGATLSYGSLAGADLTHVSLKGASLWKTDLEGAVLFYADLEHANLNEADLEGADLSNADLRSASLGSAHLEGARLALSRLWRTSFYNTEVSLGDFSQADFATAIPGEDPAAASAPQVNVIITQHGPILVADNQLSDHTFDAAWESLTTDVVEYKTQLLRFLADQLAPRGPAIATSLARYRALYEGDEEFAKAFASRLLSNAKAGKITFTDPSVAMHLQELINSRWCRLC